MKIRILIVALAAMILGACAGNAPKPLTPAQIAAIACPQLNLVHAQLSAMNAVLVADPATAPIGAKATAQLAVVHPIVTAMCNGAIAMPNVSVANIQALIQTGLPALGSLAGSLPLAPVQQAQVQAALVVAETAAGVVGVVEQQIQAAKAAPVVPSVPPIP